MLSDKEKRRFYLGAAIKDRRASNGLTQSDMSEALGVTRSMYCMMELGRTSIPTRLIPGLAAMLDVSPAGLAKKVLHSNDPSLTDILWPKSDFNLNSL